MLRLRTYSCRVDTELPNRMAHLDIMEVNELSLSSSNEKVDLPDLSKRILRKRKSLAPEITKPTNRRVNMKPRKRTLPESANRKQIEALYLNKNVKSVSQTLETIYEETKTEENSNNENLISGRKVKRLLTFQLGSQYTKEKIKKRRAKIKKLLGNKSFLNRKKIPMQVFLETIECLELDEVVKTGTSTVTSEKLI